jgi:uncharacterized YceG family protein
VSPRGGGDRTPEQREAARRERERRRYERSGEPVPDDLLEPHERAELVPEPVVPEPEPAPEPRDPDAVPPAPAAPPDPTTPGPAPATPKPPQRDPQPADPSPDHAAASGEWLGGASSSHEQSTRESHHDPQATQQWDVTKAWLDEVDPSKSTSEPAREAGSRVPKPEPPLPEEQDPDATQAHDVQADWGAAWADDERSDDAAANAAASGTSAAASLDEQHASDRPSDPDEPIGIKRVSARERRPLPNVHRPGRGGRRDTPRRGRGVRVKRPGEVAAGGNTVRRPRRIVARVVAVVAVLLAVAVVWFAISLYQPFGGGDGSGNVTVRIPNGSTAGEIGDLLAARGVVSSGFFFRLRASLSGERADLKSGTFRLRRDMSYASAIDALTRVAPPPPTVTVAVPEGRSRVETREIARSDGLRGNYVVASRRSPDLNPRRYGAPRGATLEGFLFPATYQIRKGGSATDLVTQQLRAFKQNFSRVNLSYARSKHLTAFDVLTIASMVEREVSVPRERPLVAAVIYNRLRDGMNLGIDATLRFEQNDWVNPLTESALERDTPYNTRLNPGLPPGPIGSPGLASIQAAAHPARSDVLYYVVKPGACGEHSFSSTDAQFEADVAKYNSARAAAGGKSPERC